MHEVEVELVVLVVGAEEPLSCWSRRLHDSCGTDRGAAVGTGRPCVEAEEDSPEVLLPPEVGTACVPSGWSLSVLLSGTAGPTMRCGDIGCEGGVADVAGHE